MKSKASLGTFLGFAFFLFFLSPAIPASAQSVGDEGAPKPQLPVNSTDAKTPAPADAGKVIQTKSFTLEAGMKSLVRTPKPFSPANLAVSGELFTAIVIGGCGFCTDGTWSAMLVPFQ